MDLNALSKADLIALNQQQAQKIQYLEFELAQLKRAIFGSKSERYIPEQVAGQGNLFKDEIVEEQVADLPTEKRVIQVLRRPKKQPVRQKLPSNLPREEHILEPAVDVSGMRKIGEQISEKLEIKPARFYVNKTVRPKYIDEEQNIHIAPLNDPFPKCIAGPKLVAHVAVQKFVDHLPLYRQSKIFKREQIDLPRSTMCSMLTRAAGLLNPLYLVLCKHIMESDYLQADESSIPVLTKDKPGSTMKGCMLAKVAPQQRLACFDYIKTKEKPNILRSLAGFRGYLQVDGNVTYEHKGKESGVQLMHCLVHSRRKFEHALDYDRDRAGYVLEQIKKLYLIERQAKEAGLEGRDLTQKRQQESVLILADLRKWLENNYDDEAPPNPFKTAVRYMLLRWDGLIQYTTKGELRPDNNLIENQIRPLALGRKNYLFAGSHQGAQQAALFYSFFATCQLNGLDPQEWLSDVLQRIGDHHVNKLDQLIPTHNYQLLDSKILEDSIAV